MQMGEYSRKAKKYATYPEAGTGSELAISYLQLGLLGEVGELLNLEKKVIRGDHIEKFRFVSELGDMFWYVSQYVVECGAVSVFEDRLPSPAYKPANPMKLYIEAFQFANNDPRMSYKSFMMTLLDYVHAKGINLETVLLYNLSKLERRLETGTIKGSGESVEERM